MSTPQRAPDWILKAKREGGVRIRVGAGWSNESGSISIRLDPFVVLAGGEEFTLSLWPAAREPEP